MSKARNLSNLKPSSSGLIEINDVDSSVTQLFGFKNRIINGAMMIDQRNAGASVNTNDSFPVDRFKMSFGGGGIISGQRSTTAPTGFTNSVLLTVSTADTSIAAGDYYIFQHRIEGNNTADFGFGTASASTVTVSFWVRSSIAGLYAGALHNGNDTQCYVFNYTISSTNTWEYKTITVSGSTAGTWDTTTGTGINLILDLGSGSSFNGTVNSWNTGNVFRSSGSVNWIATSGATFYITGVQLEKGSTATSFDYRPYGTELALCQRYYQIDYANTRGYAPGVSTTIETPISFRVEMRTAPTCVLIAGNRNLTTSVNVSTITNYGARHGIVSSGTGDCRAIAEIVQASSEL